MQTVVTALLLLFYAAVFALPAYASSAALLRSLHYLKWYMIHRPCSSGISRRVFLARGKPQIHITFEAITKATTKRRRDEDNKKRK